MTDFPESVVAAVLHHMNDDHTDDSLLIVRAFLDQAAAEPVMTAVDGEGGTWTYVVDGETRTGTIAWPAGTITERPEIRREVVALYDAACERLGVAPRPH